MPTKRHITRTALANKSGRVCYYCGVADLQKHAMRVSYIVPLSAGGTDVVGNMRACCAECAQRKGDTPEAEYVPERRRAVAAELAVLDGVLRHASHVKVVRAQKDLDILQVAWDE